MTDPDAQGTLAEGLAELTAIAALTEAAGYGRWPHRYRFRRRARPRILTGPVYEVELTFPVPNEQCETVRSARWAAAAL